ncbi:MAG: hypothetical protein RL264_215 [Bacteroidota bacterium]|jgi:hypothetical protein
MNNNPTSEKLTFRELIDKNKIEIPIIQRDYAQGREGKEELRENFLKFLLEAVKGTPKELDFVYGSVRNKILHPLDGQQRLTSLFLLHWFVAVKENKLNDELKNLLTNFTYETRTSSREFCIDLINKGIIYNPEQNVSELIIDSSWFFLSWKRDQTIKSMLTMLDDIQQTFQDETEVWDKLNNISFHYIELQNFGLSDDLYIKMNARGKHLTDFENFKAKFEQHINKECWEEGVEATETFSHKIDTLWTDLFWNYRDKTENVFDEQLMNFFRTMAVINYSLKAPRDDDFRRVVDLLRGDKKVSFNQYLDLGCFDEDYFKILKSILNKISDKGGLKTFLSDTTYLDEKEMFNGAIKNNLGYAELLKLFALYQYLACENVIDEENLQNWLRIVRNLVEAHRLYYDNANTFADSLLFLSKLIPHRNTIVEYFKDSVNPEDKGFPKFIIEEEKAKVNLILQNDDWKNEIIEIENHGYFNGQIGFILDWCKDENGIYNIDKFKEYSEKAKALFSNDGLIYFDNYLFERALLAKGDYLLKKGQNYSFLIDNERDISWKRLLRDDNNQRNVLKSLFDNINPTTLLQDLEKIVADFSDKNDWRYYFVKRFEMIAACGSQKLIRWNSESDILLLRSTTTSGYHKEYYSYSLFVELKEKFSLDESSYKDQKSVDYWKYFELNGKKITFDCDKEKFFWTQIDDKEWGNIQEFENREQAILTLTR